MKILILVEHDATHLKLSTLHVLSAAKKMGGEIDVMVIGEHCEKVVAEIAMYADVSRVLVADHLSYAHQLSENVAPLIATVGKGYDVILAGATTYGKNILPRVAALLDVAMLSDVIEIISSDTFVRPIYAGNILATVQIEESIKVMTIRTTAFPIAKEKKEMPAISVPIDDVIENTQSRFENETLTESTRPELTAARVIISGGRGLKSAENFHLLDAIADQLNAAIGASRAAVDAGFAPNDYQVGQTGKVVAPDLYIAVGISGAIQHLAGMKDSKVIVAINSDPEAPIFQVADYGLVGDLFKILPALQAALQQALP